MPYKEPEIKKVKYDIGEVAEMFGENVSCIRYWSDFFEEKKLIVPQRTKKDNRVFSDGDIETFRLISRLVRDLKMTLPGARQRIIDNRDGEIKNLEIADKLQRIKNLLNEVNTIIL